MKHENVGITHVEINTGRSDKAEVDPHEVSEKLKSPAVKAKKAELETHMILCNQAIIMAGLRLIVKNLIGDLETIDKLNGGIKNITDYIEKMNPGV
jgi:hypothetical protein